eukprot:TRINITY_DN2198_c0_g1_i12.p4 TRINITY_DN2198_c0_g1~~TRINITY_DN2198_c0_g1_i12.p4  ORF type:complete len:118 (-),score=26.50 TRINITY_DN2198_c0_g1_i12:187-540(-)
MSRRQTNTWSTGGASVARNTFGAGAGDGGGPLPGGRARLPWRTIVVALLLFGIGLTFLLLGGLHFWDRDRDTGVAFLVIGSLCFLPGSYATYNLWHAWRGTPGFHFHQMAEFDDFRW